MRTRWSEESSSDTVDNYWKHRKVFLIIARLNVTSIKKVKLKVGDQINT